MKKLSKKEIHDIYIKCVAAPNSGYDEWKKYLDLWLNLND